VWANAADEHLDTMSYWSTRRVVVTGGAGFLGSHVTEKLRAAGCADVFVARSRDYDLTRQDEAARLFAQHPAEIVIHLAGYVGGIGANQRFPADFFFRNIMMGVLTMHHAWSAGAEKFIAAGAGCGYPEHAPQPLREDNFWDGFPQSESAPYSLAKRMLHVQSVAYWRQHRFASVVTIPGNIYGPYDNFDLEGAHVIPSLVRKFVEAVDDQHPRVVIWGSGTPTRDFVYGGDVADGILRAAEVYDRAELVNLSTGTATSIRDVVQTLAEISGFAGEITWDASRPDGQAERRFDVTKAARQLGWTARTALRAGLEATVRWYRAHRHTARNRVD
jgi:GDP-L-fucose synthase